MNCHYIMIFQRYWEVVIHKDVHNKLCSIARSVPSGNEMDIDKHGKKFIFFSCDTSERTCP